MDNMTIKMVEIKTMNKELLEKKLFQLEIDLLVSQEKNKVHAIKTSIARIKTFLSQINNKKNKVL